jgi:hypothetical protein
VARGRGQTGKAKKRTDKGGPRFLRGCLVLLALFAVPAGMAA